MYEIKIDNMLVHGKGNRIAIEPVLSLADNSAGSLSFKLNENQKGYDIVKTLKPIITVFCGTQILWKGRIMDSSDDWYKTRTVNAEGVLTYLNDSVLRPFDVDTPLPFPQWFSRIIEEHNNQVDDYKKFKVGKVTIETKETEDDWEREITDYQKTMSVIESFLSKFGGHIVIRYESDGNYIDYLNEYSGEDFETSQPLLFGKNLINITHSYKNNGVITRLIPFGENGLTIEDVNGGNDYIDDFEAQKKYGIVTDIHTFEGIDEDDILLAEAKKYLKTANNPFVTIEATALDLSIIDKDLESFKIGNQVKIISKPHGIDGYLQLNSIRLDIANPERSEFVFGNPIESLSKKVASLTKKRQFYTWTAYADDENGGGISLNPFDKKYLGIAENQLTKEVSIKNPKIFRWAKIKGEDGKIPSEELEKIGNAVNIANEAKKESENAKKIAINYISSDSTGLMVADLKDEPQTPSTVQENTRNVLINSNHVAIRNGQNVLAKFGEIIALGDDSKMKTVLSDKEMKITDTDGASVFKIKGQDKAISITEDFTKNNAISSATNVSNEEIVAFFDGEPLELELLYNAKIIEEIQFLFIASAWTSFPQISHNMESDNKKIVVLRNNAPGTLPLAQFKGIRVKYKTDISSSSMQIGANLANPDRYMMCVGGNGTAAKPENALTVDYYGNTNCESIYVKNDIKLFYDIGDFITIDSITSNGFITSSKTEILFTIPLTKPFVSSVAKIHFHNLTIKVRQNGKYLIGTGSKSENIMNFADYEVTAIPTEQGIRMTIKMKLSPLTAAVNNDTLAVWIEDASAVCVEA